VIEGDFGPVAGAIAVHNLVDQVLERVHHHATTAESGSLHCEIGDLPHSAVEQVASETRPQSYDWLPVGTQCTASARRARTWHWSSACAIGIAMLAPIVGSDRWQTGAVALGGGRNALHVDRQTGAVALGGGGRNELHVDRGVGGHHRSR
jgi:hypothetical protein